MQKRSWTWVAAGLLLGTVALAAQAQYVWVDAKGTRHYADRPPPPDVPAERILRAPGQAPKAAPSSAAPADTAAAAPAKAAPTLAERNAEFNKRRQEQAEKDRKAAETAADTADRREACRRLQEAERTLAAGERVTRTDANGEKVFVEDDARERELAEIRRQLAQCR